MSSVKQEGGLSDEVEGSDEEASEEEWEDVSEGGGVSRLQSLLTLRAPKE